MASVVTNFCNSQTWKTEAKKQPISSGCEHGKSYICKLWKNGLIRALNDERGLLRRIRLRQREKEAIRAKKPVLKQHFSNT